MNFTNLREEDVRRLPQRMTLVKCTGIPKIFSFGFLIIFVLSAVLLGWVFKGSGIGWDGLVVVTSIVFGGICTLFWVAKKIYPKIAESFGFFPHIEYLPSDGKLIVQDLVGFANLFNHQSQMIISLESLTKICFCRTSESIWRTEFLTKKGERLAIVSSTRQNRQEALEIAQELATMSSLPLEKFGETN